MHKEFSSYLEAREFSRKMCGYIDTPVLGINGYIFVVFYNDVKGEDSGKNKK